MALVFAVEVLPVALFGIVSGSVVQRWGTRRTMLVADAAAAPLIALVPLLHAVGALSFGLLLAIVFAISTFAAPYFSSTRLLLAEILGDDERALAQGNSLLEGTIQLSGFVGPALAGVLIGTLGATTVLWIDAASYVVSFLLLWLFVPRAEPAQPGRRRTRSTCGASLHRPRPAATDCRQRQLPLWRLYPVPVRSAARTRLSAVRRTGASGRLAVRRVGRGLCRRQRARLPRRRSLRADAACGCCSRAVRASTVGARRDSPAVGCCRRHLHVRRLRAGASMPPCSDSSRCARPLRCAAR